MSDSTAIALIIVTYFLGFVSFFSLARAADAVALKVATGVVEGVPISTRQRRLLLHQSYVNYALMAVASAVFYVVVVFEIARHVTTPSVRALAYLGGFMGIIGAVGGALSFAIELVEYRSLLREGERD